MVSHQLKFLIVIILSLSVQPVFSQNQILNAMEGFDDQEIKFRLYNDVDKLTSLRPYRNYQNLESLNKAADYIFEEFQKYQANPSFQEFNVKGNTYKNVIGTFGPSEGARIVVGAHYDVHYDQPGADDNASGVAGLLEISRMLAQVSENLKYRVDLVAYTLEEQPFFSTDQMGSAFHAQYLSEQEITVRAMLCLEMIGYFSDEPESQNFPSEELSKIYPHTGDFIIVVSKRGQEQLTEEVKQLMKSNSNINVESINLPADSPLARLSDHRNYWDQGYNAVMINNTSFLRNPNYHQKSDTIETLDFDKMTEVVKGTFGAIIGLE